MRGVTRREVGAQGVALNGVGQDNGGGAGVLSSGLVGGVHLAVVVTATLQGPDFLIGPVLDEGCSARVATEEVLTHVGAVVSLESLVVTVESFVHQVHQGVVLIGSQQAVPATAPNHLNDVPAGATEEGLQLLNDLAVTAYRAV